MPKANQTRTDVLNLIFNNTALPWAAVTNLYVSLHSASPGLAGNQSTSETTYTGYTRMPIARTSGGFTVATNTAKNAAIVNFPQNTGTSVVVTHFAIGTLASGAGQILYFDAITSQPITIDTSIIPRIPLNLLVTTEE